MTTYSRLLEKGEQIGIQKGEQIGIQKGKQIGIQKGEQIGIQKGEQIGIQKGGQIGIQKGKIEGKIEVVLNCDDQGMEIEMISNITGLTEEDILKILKGHGRLK